MRLYDLLDQEFNIETKLTPEEYEQLVAFLSWIINETLYPNRTIH